MRYATQDPKYSIEVSDGGACLVNASTGTPIPLDEPVFLFRAKDRNAIPALELYVECCSEPEHVGAVEQRILEFVEFAERNPAKMKEPDTKP